jgi:hypothetical protein
MLRKNEKEEEYWKVWKRLVEALDLKIEGFEVLQNVR